MRINTMRRLQGVGVVYNTKEIEGIELGIWEEIWCIGLSLEYHSSLERL
jgi:hypothetical protein